MLEEFSMSNVFNLLGTWTAIIEVLDVRGWAARMGDPIRHRKSYCGSRCLPWYRVLVGFDSRLIRASRGRERNLARNSARVRPHGYIGCSCPSYRHPGGESRQLGSVDRYQYNSVTTIPGPPIRDTAQFVPSESIVMPSAVRLKSYRLGLCCHAVSHLYYYPLGGCRSLCVTHAATVALTCYISGETKVPRMHIYGVGSAGYF